MKSVMKLLVITLIIYCPVMLIAQSKQQKQVAEKVEQLRKAMIDGDSVMLDNLAAKSLMYRHSGGHIDDKKEFVNKLAVGKSDFVTIELLDQTISVINNKVVTVFHTLNATTNDGGKPAEVHLFVMLVWEKQQGNWKMVARQAAKKV
jgi:ketosteroid isomerase-like protein